MYDGPLGDHLGIGILQPVNHPIVGKLEDKLINQAIDAYCTTDEFKLRVLGIAEDEMITVEFCQILAANSTNKLRGGVSAQLLSPASTLTFGMLFTYGS